MGHDRPGEFVALTHCWFCNQANEILLDRRMRDISELNGKVVNTHPCNECEALMKQGILLISMRDGEGDKIDKEQEDHRLKMHGVHESRRWPFIPNPHRTGGQCVVKTEAVQRMLKGQPETLRQTMRLRWLLIEDKAWAELGLPPLSGAKPKAEETTKEEANVGGQ